MCPVHHKPMVKAGVQAAKPDSWPKEGLVLEHMYPDRNVRFMSRKDLQKACKEMGVSSGALL